MSVRADLVRLFEFEPDLLAGVDPRHAELIVDRAVVECITWDAGVIHPERLETPDDTVALVVLEGMLARRLDVYGRRAVEVIGKGDVFSPRESNPEPGGRRLSWRVYTPVRLAVLNARWTEGMARWPPVLAAITDRVADRTMRLAAQLAIAQLRELDRRLLCVLWSLAGRWGTVTRDGVLLELPLDHEVLAALASARRPSVTAALGRLAAAGRISRPGPGRWLLEGGPPPELRPEAAIGMSLH